MAVSLPPPFSPEYTIRLHNRPASLYDRFWSKVVVGQPGECWPWSPARCIAATGYGRFSVNGLLPGPPVWDSHRVAYVLTNGPIPTDMELDHVCHTMDPTCVAGALCAHRACVNPHHLEPVTHLENALRRESRRLHFRCGHPFENNRVKNGTPTGRCAECHRVSARARRAAAA